MRLTVGGNQIRPRNCSRLIDGSFFATIDLLLGANSITVLYIAMGDGFHKKLSFVSGKKKFFFSFFF